MNKLIIIGILNVVYFVINLRIIIEILTWEIVKKEIGFSYEKNSSCKNVWKEFKNNFDLIVMLAILCLVPITLLITYLIGITSLEILIAISSTLYVLGGLFALINTGEITGYTIGIIGLLLIITGFATSGLLEKSVNVLKNIFLY